MRLRRNIRGVDLACRFGGEEFVVLMPDTDWRQAQGVAERVPHVGGRKGFRTQRCAAAGGHGARWASRSMRAYRIRPRCMLKRADVALYRAKREGGQRVVFDAA